MAIQKKEPLDLVKLDPQGKKIRSIRGKEIAMIAMVLSCNPSILIADEPTTALDVTIQAQILGLIKSLQAQFGMSIIYITHNLGVIAEVSDDVSSAIQMAKEEGLFSF